MIENAFPNLLVLHAVLLSIDEKAQIVVRKAVDRWGVPDLITRNYIMGRWELKVGWWFKLPDRPQKRNLLRCHFIIRCWKLHELRFGEVSYYCETQGIWQRSDDPAKWLKTFEQKVAEHGPVTHKTEYMCAPFEPIMNEALKALEKYAPTK